MHPNLFLINGQINLKYNYGLFLKPEFVLICDHCDNNNLCPNSVFAYDRFLNDLRDKWD